MQIHALTIVSTPATVGKEVHGLFTYGVILRLMEEKADEIGEDTDGCHSKISELLNNLRRLGGKVYACVSAMALNNIMKDELTEEVNEVTGILAFFENVEGGSTTLCV